MFIRAGGSAVCRARPIVIMIWERAEPKNQLDLSTGLDWIGSTTNRLLKPPNHAAISHAFEAVQEQCSANKPAAGPRLASPRPLAVCFPNQGWW